MSLKTDDIDIRDVRLWLELGGNGDYYINLMQVGKSLFNHTGKLFRLNTTISTRISTSGGNAPSEIKLAVADLYRLFEKHGLNQSAMHESPVSEQRISDSEYETALAIVDQYKFEKQNP